MRKDKLINLITTTKTIDDEGIPVETDTLRETFAEEKSVRQSEFYQAAGAGLKPVKVFIVWSLEYQGEQKLSADNKVYRIIRTYCPNDKDTELVCEGAAT
jgi:SPP1 family predicted phage head-tail adaptor